jgi:putative oxidoreductase
VLRTARVDRRGQLGAAMVAGGAVVTLDKLPRLAALGLIASMIPTALAGHAFWKVEGNERADHEVQFLKNAGLAGGLLLVLMRSR